MATNLSNWFNVKKKLSKKTNHVFIKEREIHFICIGQNIGDEQNGKNQNFERPVIILRKFNKNLFLGIPLTSTIKTNPHYYTFRFNNKESCAILSQIRLFDTKRITRQLGYINKTDFEILKNALKNLIKL